METPEQTSQEQQQPAPADELPETTAAPAAGAQGDQQQPAPADELPETTAAPAAGAQGDQQQQQTIAHPVDVQISIRTAVDIASDEGVNLDTAAEYLMGAFPGYFADHAAALAAVTAEAQKLGSL